KTTKTVAKLTSLMFTTAP
ncbi:beta galactosidase small chain family protein, partial [Vibrio parahaemolyticus AQ3810]